MKIETKILDSNVSKLGDDTLGLEAPPTFSVISAVYNVDSYLDDFLGSMQAQLLDHSEFELILVSDGSPDNSEEIIKKWISATDIPTTLIQKENGGQASARNVGIDFARGTWVTFCDPDDFLDVEYFNEINRFIDENQKQELDIIATRVVQYYEDIDLKRSDHALEKRFKDGSRIVDLRKNPESFHMHGPTSIIRREPLLKSGLKFEERLRFSFEDAHFVAAFILQMEHPLLGYATKAEYYYRKRSSGDSAIQTGAQKPEKYTDVLLYGHLDLIDRCKNNNSPVPEWLQFLLMYDVLWYFRGDRKVGAPSKQLPPEIKSKFHELVEMVIKYIDVSTICSFEVMGTDWELRNALLIGYKNVGNIPTVISALELDPIREMTLLRYTFRGDTPEEIVKYRGIEFSPKLTKTKPFTFFDRVLFSNRFIWVPARGKYSVHLNGVAVPIELGGPRRDKYSYRPFTVSKALADIDITTYAQQPKKPLANIDPAWNQKPATDMMISRSRTRREIVKELFASFKPRKNSISSIGPAFPLAPVAISRKDQVFSTQNRNSYSDAWILMDRVDRANDNAEHLYRYLMHQQPEVNAWFSIQRESPDWDRLEAEGFKLIEYGTDDFENALCHSVIYASSHLDRFITDPLPKDLRRYKSWQFVFLQHGVTKDDMSSWFNSKKIDLLITSTRAEYLSIVKQGSPYNAGQKNVRLTGFPRHDQLLSSEISTPKWLLISPTWRSGLVSPANSDGSRELIGNFKETTYCLAWQQLLNSQELKVAALRSGLKIGFLPHPMVEPYLDQLQVPEYVEILRWHNIQFAKLISESSLLVTDYSSTAFEAAYRDLPVVYYQFDANSVLAGGHIYERGYFDYEKHGFGPVEITHTGTVVMVDAALQGKEQLKYSEIRMNTFAYRDNNNSARVFNAIKAIMKPTAIRHILKEV